MKTLVKKNYKNILLFPLFLIAIVSLLRGIYNAYIRSHDFNYSPAVMAWEGKNHYLFMLEGGNFFASQNGEYLQALYVLYYPFTLLSWEYAKISWMTINTLLAIFLPIFIGRKFELKNYTLLILVCLFLAGTPSRNVIGNGQLGLVIMAFLIIPFYFKSFFYILISGISYIKYNIGYLLFLYFISRGEIKKLGYSLIIIFLGWVIYCYITNSNLIDNLFQPLQLALHLKITSEFPYGFSFLKILFSDFEYIEHLISFFSITLSLMLLFLINRLKDSNLKVSQFCLIILFLSPHHIYDYVLLLPLLAYSLKNFFNGKVFQINIIVIFYFYFGLRIMKEFGVNTDLNIIINYSNIAILAFLFFYNHIFYKRSIMKADLNK